MPTSLSAEPGRARGDAEHGRHKELANDAARPVCQAREGVGATPGLAGRQGRRPKPAGPSAELGREPGGGGDAELDRHAGGRPNTPGLSAEPGREVVGEAGPGRKAGRAAAAAGPASRVRAFAEVR